MKIYIWQLKPSMHQVALVRALKRLTNVTWIMQEKDFSPKRKEMGWEDGGIKPDLYLNSGKRMKEFINTLQPDSVHLFGGFCASNGLSTALKYCLHNKMNVYVQSEAYRNRGLKGKVNALKLQLDYKLYYKNKIKGVFAMGNLGVEYFTEQIGFSKEIVHAFGYFTNILRSPTFKKNQDAFNIIYVGQLIRRKGVDILINSCAQLDGNWSLKIIGKGPLLPELQKKSQNIKSGEISFIGVLPNAEVQNLISEADVLVLPSRWDGWGAVVNEALMNGTPVISTDKCGSSMLLSDGFTGEVVISGSVNSLYSALVKRKEKGKLSNLEKQQIRNWATCLTGEVAAGFVLDVFKGNKPINNPWIL